MRPFFNPFNREGYAFLLICNSLKAHEKLEHFGICDSTFSLLSNHLKSRRFSLQKKSWDLLGRYLSNKKYDITNLNLKYCKIYFLFAGQFLSKSLLKNKSLIKLNLYNTSIDDVTGSLIIQNLWNHKILIENWRKIFIDSFL